MATIPSVIDKLTVRGELYESLPDGSVRCFACGHRCLIRPGKRGICQVRFNENGELRVPWGYVAALQSDPIEKKPFFHVFPGSNALTFGMLGCDFHCSYCFPGDTIVITERGPMTLEECFQASEWVDPQPGAEVGHPRGLRAIASSGKPRPVRAVFKHHYRGPMLVIQPYYMPALRCTPDHKVFATRDPRREPVMIRAEDLGTDHFLVIPRQHQFSTCQEIDVRQVLSSGSTGNHQPWKLSMDEIQDVLSGSVVENSQPVASSQGSSSLRRILDRLQPFAKNTGHLPEPPSAPVPAADRGADLPERLPLDENMARLLGIYCARGTVIRGKQRPDSLHLRFRFTLREGHLAEQLARLLARYFNAPATREEKGNNLDIWVSRTSLGLLFKSIAGASASEKHVPEQLFESPEPVSRAFLGALAENPESRMANGRITLTVASRDLAHGIAWLALKLGYLPSINPAVMPSQPGNMDQHTQPYVYTVVWYTSNDISRHAIPTRDSYLVPIRELHTEPFNGPVYNMEVEQEHNYLADFFLVSNCQNWMTSQAMRDPASDDSVNFIRKVTPQGMVQAAHRTGASVVVSSYNEPLITSEWAVGIFKEARAAGLKCAYVSNGNNTLEVMEYIRPYIDAYKVDLKCMQDKNYRKLGGVLQNTLDGIQRAHDMGLWVEVVTLTIPDFNDSSEELWDAARFIAGVSKDIPWHVTAFHQDYKMLDHQNTSADILLRAAEIGREAGLSFVYAGNLPGRLQEYENTYCPDCGQLLIERHGYVIYAYQITGEGACPKCKKAVPGLWPRDPSDVHLHGLGFPLPVY
jgi:pyruvate formate lyase activating enzyme